MFFIEQTAIVRYTQATMSKLFMLLILVASIGGTIMLFHSDTSLADKPQEVDTLLVEDTSSVVVPKAPLLDTYTVQEGDTFAAIFEKQGLGYSDMLALVSDTEDVYDFTRVRVGNDLRFLIEADQLVRLEYDIDSNDMAVVTYEAGSYEADIVAIPYDIERVVARGTIDSSLFLAGAKAGLHDKTILDVADIFAWSVDFVRNIREGDEFAVLYEKRFRNGEEALPGKVLAVEFVNAGKQHTGFAFADDDGDVSYYAADGSSLIKQFLKAPLKYSKITSGYSLGRLHPVLGINIPHKAIDYAAPVGTPVYATADGVINYAGWRTQGFGNFIRIHHNSSYSTEYSHLNGIADGITPGVAVSQGDLIGYVGSTGYSTGAHLDYAMFKNGEAINPLTVDLPSGEPVSEEKRAEFDVLTQALARELGITL